MAICEVSWAWWIYLNICISIHTTKQNTQTEYPFKGWSSSSLLKLQHFPESGILLRTIRAYWSKRRGVPPVLFRTNYYSIEILHGVTAIILTYHPHHAKLYLEYTRFSQKIMNLHFLVEYIIHSLVGQSFLDEILFLVECLRYCQNII